MAMFELNWSSFEPTQGTVSSSYLATMKYELASYQVAGQKPTPTPLPAAPMLPGAAARPKK